MIRFVPFIAALLMIGCSTKPHVIDPVQRPEANRSHAVYVVSHGWHAGLIVPAASINQRLPELSERFGKVAFYEIGWGDKGFYQAAEITTGLTLQAMFWSSGAALHVVALDRPPRDYFPGSQIVETCLSNEQLHNLSTFIANSFARTADGAVIRLQNGIYGNSQFYEAEGRYYLLNTCNKWTAKSLRSAGLPIRHTWKLTAGSVMRSIGKHQQSCSASSNVTQAPTLGLAKAAPPKN